jgi:predicted nucleic acid-binding protein
MIVADTNIISYLLLPTSYSDSVDKLFTLDPAWIAPSLWKSEFRNVLALYLRKELITFDKALQLQETAESVKYLRQSRRLENREPLKAG